MLRRATTLTGSSVGTRKRSALAAGPAASVAMPARTTRPRSLCSSRERTATTGRLEARQTRGLARSRARPRRRPQSFLVRLGRAEPAARAAPAAQEAPRSARCRSPDGQIWMATARTEPVLEALDKVAAVPEAASMERAIHQTAVVRVAAAVDVAELSGTAAPQVVRASRLCRSRPRSCSILPH